jgi:ribose transport system ATP-binding protein
MTGPVDHGRSERSTAPGSGASQAPGPSGAGEAPVPVLALSGLYKSFGGAHALEGVDLTVLPGEVHGLLGENGSGKSTLIKVLNGFHAPDSGSLEIAGEPVPLPLAPGQFRELGLSFVHQDLGLIPELSVLENLRVGELIAQRGAWIGWRQERRQARETFAHYGLALDPSAPVSELTGTERALLAIVRAVEGIRTAHSERGTRHGLLVLDEPTVFLPRDGTEQLFRIVREIVASGDESVLFVSHDLDEVREVTDRVTVLRDGRLQGTVNTAETNEAQLVEMIIGRYIESMFIEGHELSGHGVDLAVRGLSGGVLEHVDFDIRRGEILGLTGLAGSGFEDIPYFLFGANPSRAGSLSARGITFDLTQMTPDRAVRNGFAMLPADRQRDGSVSELPVGDNLMLQVLPAFRGRVGLRRRPMNRRAHELLHEFDVRPADPSATYEELSGGNQQKAMLAKWLQTKPKVIFLHEPTQGVDVGARAQIFSMLGEAAQSGACVLCASSDYEQLAAVCDRVLVVANGHIAREISGEVTKERIAEQVYNSVTLRDTTKEVAS